MIKQTADDIALEKRLDQVCNRFDNPNTSIDEKYEILAELKELRAMRSDNQKQFMEQQIKAIPVSSNGEVKYV